MNDKLEKKKLFTVAEVGKLLGVSKVVVYGLIKHRLIKAMNLGGFKIAAVEIDRFLEAYNGMDLKNLDEVIELKVEDIKSSS